MALAVTIFAGLALAAWVYLGLFRGGFWRADQRLGTGPVVERADWPGVVAVIPARDEAAVIDRTIRSLLAQDYPRAFAVIVVDDDSGDGTADVARAAAAPDWLTVIEGQAAPPGWTGKVWAMAQGVAQAARLAPDARYILFSDADIEHGQSSLRRLVARAEAQDRDLVSIMVELTVGGVWERLLIPAFVFFFQMLYPFACVNRAGGRIAAAAGGCMLVRRAALDRAGGLAAIRGALIDDCALARAVRSSGGSLWLGLTTETRSTRPYGGLAGVWNMVARSAYTQLGHSPLMLGGAVLGMALVFLIPPLAVFAYPLHGAPAAALAGLAAFAAMIGAYAPTVRLYRQPYYVAFLLPVAALLYTAMTIDSARRHWRGSGGNWKGRVYPR